MALSLDQFEDVPVPSKCTVGRLLAALPAPDREVLEAALADPSVRSSRIEQVLREEGHNLLQATIGRHRRQYCKC